MPKQAIRTRFLKERNALSAERRADTSLLIQQRFLQSEMFQRAGVVALYSAIRNEVLTDEVAACAHKMGKVIAYPRVRGEELEFVKVFAQEELARGAFGVLEPVGSELLEAERLDLVLVPGVVFDTQGHRLGYGRGFYDRALAACRVETDRVGFGYDFQLVERLPAREHDEPLSALVTESHIINFPA